MKILIHSFRISSTKEYTRINILISFLHLNRDSHVHSPVLNRVFAMVSAWLKYYDVMIYRLGADLKWRKDQDNDERLDVSFTHFLRRRFKWSLSNKEDIRNSNPILKHSAHRSSQTSEYWQLHNSYIVNI